MEPTLSTSFQKASDIIRRSNVLMHHVTGRPCSVLYDFIPPYSRNWNLGSAALFEEQTGALTSIVSIFRDSVMLANPFFNRSSKEVCSSRCLLPKSEMITAFKKRGDFIHYKGDTVIGGRSHSAPTRKAFQARSSDGHHVVIAKDGGFVLPSFSVT